MGAIRLSPGPEGGGGVGGLQQKLQFYSYSPGLGERRRFLWPHPSLVSRVEVEGLCSNPQRGFPGSPEIKLHNPFFSWLSLTTGCPLPLAYSLWATKTRSGTCLPGRGFANPWTVDSLKTGNVACPLLYNSPWMGLSTFCILQTGKVRFREGTDLPKTTQQIHGRSKELSKTLLSRNPPPVSS